MGEKSQLSSSRSGKGVSALTIKKANKVPAKPGGRILLPSKLKPVGTAASGGSSVPMKSRCVVGTARKSSATRQMEDLYDSYVMDFLNLTFMKELEDIQEEDHLDTEVIKIIGILSNADVIVRTYVDKFVLKLWEDLKYLEIMSGAFDNLLDFAGEETLIEIQSLLVKKFEKITIEGAAVEESIFHDAELKSVYDLLKSNLSGQVDKNKISGFIQIFGETLNNLLIATNKTELLNQKLQHESKIALEHCSLSICNLALDSFAAVKDGEKQEQEEGDKNDTKAVKLDEDRIS